MIKALIEILEEGNIFIKRNEKKIVTSNCRCLYDTLTFLGLVCLFFIIISFFFYSGAVSKYLAYLIPIVIDVLLIISYKYIISMLDNNLGALRIYCMLAYYFLIISFTFADCYSQPKLRAMFFPAAMLVFSTVYVDTFVSTTRFKLILEVSFLIIDFIFKTPTLVLYDFVASVLAIFASCFVHMTVMKSTLSTGEANMILLKKSQTDLLTGLYNKLSFEEKAIEILEDRYEGAKATLFIFDLDYFKDVNDNFGHQTGDMVLKQFASIIKGYFHPTDIIGRIGGDEFMVLVMGEMGEDFVERRCRNIIHEIRTYKVGKAAGFSCSIGVAEDTNGLAFNDMYSLADKALYKAKENGRCCYVIEKN